MTINADLQRLEVGHKILLFSVDGSAFGGPELYFHNHTIPYTEAELENPDDLPIKSIWWQGVEYKPWPVRIEGLEVNSDGRTVSPTLSVANLDGTISAMCLAYQNMAQARVTLRMTFAHYLDARNFPEGNPEANPTQEKIDVYYIDSKTHEDNTEIHFALSSPADLQGVCAGYIESPPATIPVIVILMKTAIQQMIHQKMPALDYCQQDVSHALGKGINFPTVASPVQR
ncbi:hypothetical protein XBFM1_460002 [Xenorhabdus bovienii str. feltiae Moldova]|uniref:Uncharacterized protein n=1 Tax=Xenorhabdus bovienii str. feltiae Moldova TaxID=1398200 RepID=A0A077NL56_XENBV|nr:hypothetical protein XBFM1_460002 [Xenorhabdus bovienii str. feltiae Moldova]